MIAGSGRKGHTSFPDLPAVLGYVFTQARLQGGGSGRGIYGHNIHRRESESLRVELMI